MQIHPPPSAPPERSRPAGWAQNAFPLLAATALLIGAGKLGMTLATLHDKISAVWPATGVAIWLLIRFGLRAWPAVTAAILIVEIGFAGFPLQASVLAALGATLEAVAGAWLWQAVHRRWPGDTLATAACVLAALVAPVTSASIGATAVAASGAMAVTWSQLWVTWWTGNAIGALAVLPVLLALPALGRMVRLANWPDAGKALVVLAAAAVVSWLSFRVVSGAAFLFSIFPVLLLAAVWFEAPGARLVALLIAAAGIVAEFSGHGLFGGGSVNSNLLHLQVFLASVAIAALVLPLFRVPGGMLLPATVLLVGWTLSGWIFATLERDGRARQENVFNDRVAVAEAAIRVRVKSYVDALRGGASFYVAAKSVDRVTWRAYAESLQLAERYPGINGLGLIFPLRPADVGAWRDQIRMPGDPEPVIRPFPGTTGPEEDIKYVISMLEPAANNTTTVGRNIATEPSRRLAADLARDTGEPQINRRIPRSRDTQRRAGFLLYVPIYQKGATLGTVAERRAAHLGWVYAQFYADNFLNGVLDPMKDTLGLHFFEEGDLDRSHLLFASGEEIVVSGTDPVRIGRGPLPAFERVTRLEMGGQRFQLGWQRGPKYDGGEPSQLAWVAVSFTFATLLMAGLVLNLQSTGRRAQVLAVERTRELAATQTRLQGVLDGTAFGVIVTTPEGVIELFNVGAERMLGYTAAEMIGRQTPALLHLPAEVAARARELGTLLGREIPPGHETLVAAARVNKSDEREWTYLRKDGSHLPVLLSVTALRDHAGTIVHFLGIAQDITARKAAEAAREEYLARLQKLGAQLPGMIYQFRQRPDGTSCFPYSSEGIRTIYRVTPDEVREDASKVFGVLHPDDFAAIVESIQISARTLQPWRHEYRIRYPDGTVRWLLGNSVPEREADGSVLWHGYISDSTERKLLEENLALSRDQALEASRLKSEFLATMSHEIRTPMNAVIGMAGLLAGTPLNREQDEMVRTLAGGAENLLAIVSDILDFSRIEAGRLRLDAADFDLSALLAETTALLAPRAHEKGLTLTNDLTGAPATLLLGDAGRVRQVLTNLVGNAIKFTDSGTVGVTVRTLAETEGHARVRLEVRDTGPGIAPELKPRLFQPFTQGDGSTTRRFGGTGLGLAISRQLAERMGGTIGCESAPGKGSLFWFEAEFPRRGPLPAAAPAKTGPVAGIRGGGGRRLLVAEDNVANQRVATMVLEKMGYVVEIAVNGRDALEQLATKQFDGLLADCQMPVLDGYETARRIRTHTVPAINPQLPIIAFTAHARPEDRARCREAGMDDFLTKPLRVPELQTALERCGLWHHGAAAVPTPETQGTESPGDGVLDERAMASTRALLGAEAEALLREVVALYLADEPERLIRLERLAAGQHATELADEAHSFGGNAAVFGGMQVRRAALELERAARAGEWPAALAQLTELRAACARLRAELARRSFAAP